MKKLLALVPLVALCMSMGIVTQGQEGQQIGRANPAATHCTRIGGTYTLEGNIGYCHKDGKTCEEWALFHHECEL